ncbi:MAG: Nif11-like leader peptide family RiPP precursor [Syntrophomonadaceae bacterium]|nr:Nif11-like leader peptide family RiPP precursor [Syntrophomonadaceae bacterium]
MEQKLAKLQAKIKEDKSFGEKLFSLENSEEVQSFLHENGLEFSLEEINRLKDVIVKTAAKAANGEISDDDLEDVAGGSFINDLMNGYNGELGKFQRTAKPILRRISDARW